MVQQGQFGRYELERLLGQGGMGQVWVAYDPVTRRRVALKVLAAHHAEDAEFRRRFLNEAETAAQLQEPHVVPIHSFGEVDGQLYIDMALIEGEDVETLLRQHGPMSAVDATAIIGQAAAALDAAHRAGLVHRDVKPSNLFRHSSGFVYLIDFGIAHNVSQSRITSTGAAIGTAAYMAPERFQGQSGPSIDVYALACVLYECLTGNPPYGRIGPEQQMYAHLTQPPPVPSRVVPGLPGGLDAVIARGLAKNPTERFASAGALASAAQQALGTPPAHLSSTSPGLDTPSASAPAYSTSGGRASEPTTAGRVDEPLGEAYRDHSIGSGGANTSATPRKSVWWKSPVALVSAATIALGGGTFAAIQLWPDDTPANAAGPSTTTSGPSTIPSGATSGSGPGTSATSGPVAGTGACGSATTLRGSGSSVQQGLIEGAVDAHRSACPTATVSYTPVGAGAGRQAFLTGMVDFGASEQPLDTAQMEQAKSACTNSNAINLPMAFAPIVLAYNVPGVPELMLNGPVAAKIFNGSIKAWNDPAIAALNSGTALPSTPISVVFRQGGAGITDTVQRYFRQASSGAWTQDIGSEFTGGVGTGFQRSTETVDEVAKKRGSITYVEKSVALAKKLPMASFATLVGPVEPTTSSIQTTIDEARVAPQAAGDRTLDESTILGTKRGYPLVQPTYEIVCRGGQRGPAAQRELAVPAFLTTLANLSPTAVEQAGFVPLPPTFKTTTIAAINTIR